MGQKLTLSITCDICPGTPVVFEGERAARAAGWLLFSVDGAIDRDFIDKAICPHCVTTVEAGIKKLRGEQQDEAYSKAVGQQFGGRG